MNDVSIPSQTGSAPEASRAGAPRPSVINLAIHEKAALHAAYMPFLQGGGLFVTTTRPATLGDDLYLILTLPGDTAKFAVPGKVAWITPPGSTGRQQGLGIQFGKTEASEQVKKKIEELLGGALKSSRATHTL